MKTSAPNEIKKGQINSEVVLLVTGMRIGLNALVEIIA
jgi:hypothetical protein